MTRRPPGRNSAPGWTEAEREVSHRLSSASAERPDLVAWLLGHRLQAGLVVCHQADDGDRVEVDHQGGRPDGLLAKDNDTVSNFENNPLVMNSHGPACHEVKGPCCCSLAACLADLLRQESLPAMERRLRRYTTPHLLVIDEIGYLPCDQRSADLLFHIVSRRHEERSLVITTNLSFKDWGSVFPGAACVAALIDRFVQHCEVLDINATSWRQKDSSRP